MLHGFKNKTTGLVGHPLLHSFSPEIHALLADYDYALYDLGEREVAEFLQKREFDAVNITIPYKETVIPYLDEIDEAARKIGAVNTVVKRGGRLYGYNTDYTGFLYTLRKTGISVTGKKALVLGTGGAAKTVVAVLRDMGAAEIVSISRSGEHHYGNMDKETDAALIVNATPVGMFPENGVSPIPIPLSLFKMCEGVIDLIYNPLKTKLILDAEAAGIPAHNGLSMLVSQAKRAAALFTDNVIEDAEIEKVTALVEKKRRNLVLIGMPGCGKTTVGRILATRLGRPLYDTDAMVIARTGQNIPDIFRKEGESAFRRYETQATMSAGRETGAVIATGGGILTRRENRALLAQNGIFIFMKRSLRRLATAGRPLSDPDKLEKMYENRLPLYESCADYTVDVSDDPEETANNIMEMLG